MPPSVQTHNGNGHTKTVKKVNKIEEYAGRKIVGGDAQIELVCHQRSALLVDSMSNEDVEKILVRGERPVPIRDAPLSEMCLKKLYRGPSNQLVLRTEMLFACLRNAGRKIKVGKTAISTAKTTELPSFLVIEDEYLELFNPDTGKPLTDDDWIPDLRRGMMDNAGKKTAVGIVRPRFNRWAFHVTISVDYSGIDGLTEKHVYQLFEVAGRRIGVGSYNPVHNGPFGRFKIVEFNVME